MSSNEIGILPTFDGNTLEEITTNGQQCSSPFSQTLHLTLFWGGGGEGRGGCKSILAYGSNDVHRCVSFIIYLQSECIEKYYV